MGQPVSKGPPTTSPFPQDLTVQNYQVYPGGQGQINYAPGYPPQQPVYPAPKQYGLGCRRPPQSQPQPPIFVEQPMQRCHPMDEDFWNDDCDFPGYPPQPRGRPGPPGQSPGGYFLPTSGVQDRSLAMDILGQLRMNQQMIEPGLVRQDRSTATVQHHPPVQISSGPGQPSITKFTTVVHEPKGWTPAQSGQSSAAQVQSYAPQQQIIQQVAPQQDNSSQPIILVYDPTTGTITGGQNTSAGVAPSVLGIPQTTGLPQGVQMITIPQAQTTSPQAYVLSGAQGLSGLSGVPIILGQGGASQQPIIIPAQMYSG